MKISESDFFLDRFERRETCKLGKVRDHHSEICACMPIVFLAIQLVGGGGYSLEDHRIFFRNSLEKAKKILPAAGFPLKKLKHFRLRATHSIYP